MLPGKEAAWASAQSELISLATGVFGSIVTVFVLFELLAFESEPTEFVRTLLVAISPFVVFLGVVWLLVHRPKKVAATVALLLLVGAFALVPLQAVLR